MYVSHMDWPMFHCQWRYVVYIIHHLSEAIVQLWLQVMCLHPLIMENSFHIFFLAHWNSSDRSHLSMVLCLQYCAGFCSWDYQRLHR